MTEELIAQMLAGHQERMHRISQTAMEKSQEMGQRLLENVRDPLVIRAERIGLIKATIEGVPNEATGS